MQQLARGGRADGHVRLLGVERREAFVDETVRVRVSFSVSVSVMVRVWVWVQC